MGSWMRMHARGSTPRAHTWPHGGAQSRLQPPGGRGLTLRLGRGSSMASQASRNVCRPAVSVGRRASPCSPTGQNGYRTARIDDRGGHTDSHAHALSRPLLAERADAVGLSVDVTGDVGRRWLAVAAVPVDDVLAIGARLSGRRERSDPEEHDQSD